MRWRGLRRARWAAWLGVIALGLNALVPVHLAFDLTEALAATHRPVPVDDSGFRSVVAALALHAEHVDNGRHLHHHHHDADHHGAACPVCAALGSLAALTLAAPAPVAIPVSLAAPRFEPPPLAGVAAGRFPAGYRSRAPPLFA